MSQLRSRTRWRRTGREVIVVIEVIRRRLAEITVLASNDPDEKAKFNAWIVKQFRQA